MYRCLIIFIFCVLAGCVHFTRYLETAQPLLPDVASLACCWQAFEQLEIEFEGEQLTLSSVTAVHDNKLTVVILDPLGRRIFSVIQSGSDVQIEKSVQIQGDFPVEWLLIGIYLRNMPDSGWSFEHSNWTVTRDIDHVLLKQDNRIKVSLVELVAQDNAIDNMSRQDLTAQLQYPDIKLKVNIKALLRQSL